MCICTCPPPCPDRQWECRWSLGGEPGSSRAPCHRCREAVLLERRPCRGFETPHWNTPSLWGWSSAWPLWLFGPSDLCNLQPLKKKDELIKRFKTAVCKGPLHRKLPHEDPILFSVRDPTLLLNHAGLYLTQTHPWPTTGESAVLSVLMWGSGLWTAHSTCQRQENKNMEKVS